MYHYIRDLPNTSFPRLKGMLTSDFQSQVKIFQSHFEMATLESALAYLQGTYKPSRDLCLLTFDDGLKEHYAEVTPILKELGVQGIFFVITNKALAPVHMNHFLLATLEFETYQKEFYRTLEESCPGMLDTLVITKSLVRHTYPWDDFPLASFKYVVNFMIERDLRDRVLTELFRTHMGDPSEFSESLYVSWDEARAMQKEGMVIGGHSHQHKPLSTLSDKELSWDLTQCRQTLDQQLLPQQELPFCFPYGQRETVNALTLEKLQELGFSCAFLNEPGANYPGQDHFLLQRFDCKDAVEKMLPQVTVH
jgi:Polysaccharide deacetylase